MIPVEHIDGGPSPEAADSMDRRVRPSDAAKYRNIFKTAIVTRTASTNLWAGPGVLNIGQSYYCTVSDGDRQNMSESDNAAAYTIMFSTAPPFRMTKM